MAGYPKLGSQEWAQSSCSPVTAACRAKFNDLKSPLCGNPSMIAIFASDHERM
jgi:hypothetical protein